LQRHEITQQYAGDDLSQPRTVPEETARWMRRATYASVATAASLIVIKLFAWSLSGSLSILASLIDSFLDAAASMVSFFAVRHALQPADSDHRFGHGKAEPLAALGQAAFIAGSAVFLTIEAVDRLFSPHPLEYGGLGIGVMVISITATLALVTFQRIAIRKTGSMVVKADSLHYVGDLFANLAVIAALVLSTQLAWFWADPLFGLGIAVYILYNAWQIAKQALDMLMDRELQDEDRAEIRRILLQNPEVRGYHDLRTRASGPQVFIQCHLELDGKLSLLEAHAIADRVENQLETAFPGAEVILHEDPFPQESPKNRNSRPQASTG